LGREYSFSCPHPWSQIARGKCDPAASRDVKGEGSKEAETCSFPRTLRTLRLDSLLLRVDSRALLPFYSLLPALEILDSLPFVCAPFTLGRGISSSEDPHHSQRSWAPSTFTSISLSVVSCHSQHVHRPCQPRSRLALAGESLLRLGNPAR
jgi:hypothetical protein